jgi:transcription antitermination factor NusG
MPSTLYWFALRVRTRSELQVAGVLEQKGFECFTPAVPESRIYKDRTRKLQAALFPGYAFCRFALNDCLQVVTTGAVQKIVTDGSAPAPIADEEIESIRRMCSSASVRPWPYLSIGQKVRVKEGLFEGIEGYLISGKGKNRLVVSVDVVQSAISVELDSYQLAAVSAAPATCLQGASR